VRKSFATADLKMIPSSGGIFEVTVDDRLVFSKKALGRHAEPGEVMELIRQCA
jgi:selenoprotein W-related protein